METCQPTQTDGRRYKPYMDTARRLLDGLIIYRYELGETGRQLELLLRCGGVAATTDTRSSGRLQ